MEAQAQLHSEPTRMAMCIVSGNRLYAMLCYSMFLSLSNPVVIPPPSLLYNPLQPVQNLYHTNLSHPNQPGPFPPLHGDRPRHRHLSFRRHRVQRVGGGRWEEGMYRHGVRPLKCSGCSGYGGRTHEAKSGNRADPPSLSMSPSFPSFPFCPLFGQVCGMGAQPVELHRCR